MHNTPATKLQISKAATAGFDVGYHFIVDAQDRDSGFDFDPTAWDGDLLCAIGGDEVARRFGLEAKEGLAWEQCMTAFNEEATESALRTLRLIRDGE